LSTRYITSSFRSLEEELLGGAHGGLDVEHLDVLPVLLEQRDQEVDGELHVQADLGVGHGNVSHGKGDAHDLLHLEFDGGLGGVHLLLHVVVVVKEGRELAGLGKAGSEDTGDLLDEGTGGQKTVVLAGELLDQLFVLVELLEVLDVHRVDAQLLGGLAVSLVTKNAHIGVELGAHRELEGAGETFVTLGIVVLQGDLELDGLGEFSLLALEGLARHDDVLAVGELEDVLNAVGKEFAIKFAHFT